MRKPPAIFIWSLALRRAKLRSVVGKRHGGVGHEEQAGVPECPQGQGQIIDEAAFLKKGTHSAGVARVPEVEVIFVESGGDNFSASFSPELVDKTIYVIDVATGDKIPRKGGPSITQSDLLVVNKIDLAPFVGANLEVMAADALRMRGSKPLVFSNLRAGLGLDTIADFVETARLAMT